MDFSKIFGNLFGNKNTGTMGPPPPPDIPANTTGGFWSSVDWSTVGQGLWNIAAPYVNRGAEPEPEPEPKPAFDKSKLVGIGITIIIVLLLITVFKKLK